MKLKKEPGGKDENEEKIEKKTRQKEQRKRSEEGMKRKELNVL